VNSIMELIFTRRTFSCFSIIWATSLEAILSKLSRPNCIFGANYTVMIIQTIP
jgi:hypothetical protein